MLLAMLRLNVALGRSEIRSSLAMQRAPGSGDWHTCLMGVAAAL
jgi:hypothetical protein